MTLNNVKQFIINSLTSSTVIFGAVYLFAIFMNGLKGTNIDTSAIIMGYGVVAGKGLVNHTINSTLNSERGSMPTQNASKK